MINGTSNDTVRAAHEQIILAMRESATDAETLRVRKLAIDCFEEQLARDLDPSDYVYLLHCLIGILHFKELLTKLDRVVELIRHQYRAAKYRYLVTLYDSQPDLIRALPTSSVLQLLDAMQKSSSFSKGMTAIQLLRAGGFQDTELLTLFEAKYDIQTYQPAEALRKLQGVGVSGMQLLCKTNALQCLALDQEARSVVDAVIEAQPRSEEDFVVLRNSAHLFSAADARKNLMQSLGFFKDRGHLFGEATVLNNLGVLYLWERSFDDAERVLDKARSIMESLASDEIFQSQINLGVLETLRGNYTNADNWLRLARSYVPRELQLDKVLVDLDTTLLGVVAGRVTPAEAVHSMRVLHREAGMLNDPRLRNSIAFNMRELALLTDSAPGVEVEPRFDELFQSRSLSGFEVIENFVVETAKGRCLFVLSPHWRH